MTYYFMIIDLILPITFLLMPIISKLAIKKGINGIIGFRTGKSMENKVNWEKANSLLGKYSLCLGIFSIILTLIVWIIKPYSIETNSLILVSINLIIFILLTILINKKI